MILAKNPFLDNHERAVESENRGGREAEPRTAQVRIQALGLQISGVETLANGAVLPFRARLLILSWQPGQSSSAYRG